jgi:hypothetical protein
LYVGIGDPSQQRYDGGHICLFYIPHGTDYVVVQFLALGFGEVLPNNFTNRFEICNGKEKRV